MTPEKSTSPVGQCRFLVCLVLALLTAQLKSPLESVAQCDPEIPAPLIFVSPQQTNIIEDVLPPVLDSFGFEVAARDSAVGVEGCGRFMIAWEVDAYAKDEFSDHGDSLMIQRVAPDGVLDGAYSPLTADLPDTILSEEQRHMEPSIAISPAGNVRVAWISDCMQCRTEAPGSLANVAGAALGVDFGYDASPGITTALYPSPIDYWHVNPSAGRNDAGAALSAWSSIGEGPTGVREGPSYDVSQVIRPCAPICFPGKWRPALATRPTGEFCVAWAEAEEPENPLTFFNIALQLYDSSGSIVQEISGQASGDWVNDTSMEPLSTEQVSPSVAFDSQGNIVVAWVGPGQDFLIHVFARRFFWAGGAAPIESRSAPFIVDSDTSPTFGPAAPADANPTVSLVQDSAMFPAADPGRFLIAWNARKLDGPKTASEIRAQYFEADGRPMGREFRVNQATGPTTPGGETFRRLADSARHTVAYGGAGHAMFTWQSCGGFAPNTCEAGFSHYTVLPVGFAEHQDALNPCCKGDADGNGLVDGRDIQSFVDLLLAPPAVIDIVAMCPFDMNDDAALTIDDAA
jgi:hypothetical protein